MKTIQTELVEKGLKQADTQEINKENKKPKERLSEQELKELMGSNRDTFKIHRGAILRR